MSLNVHVCIMGMHVIATYHHQEEIHTGYTELWLQKFNSLSMLEHVLLPQKDDSH